MFSRALSLINRLIKVTGVQLRRTNSPTRTFLEFFGHLKRLGIKFETIIDVGFADGTPAIYDSFPHARYYVFEPLEECRALLERLKIKLNLEYFVVAAGARDGHAAFNVHNDLSGSSLFSQAEGKILDGVQRSVPMVRLESVLPTNLARPCLLKIDTQGAELQVLEGLGDRLDEIDVVIVEASLMKFREGIPEFADIVRWLDSHDFVVYEILEGHVRQLDNALAQVDLAMVKRDGVLRKDRKFFSDAQLIKYAARRHASMRQ
jgi:FkbM family methyltransferase